MDIEKVKQGWIREIKRLFVQCGHWSIQKKERYSYQYMMENGKKNSLEKMD